MRRGPRRQAPDHRGRRLRAASAAVLSAALLSACAGGSSSPPAGGGSGLFATCLTSPLPVTGGRIDVLSVRGSSCTTAARVMVGVLAQVDRGRNVQGRPAPIDGWRCSSLAGIDQTACTSGPAMLYAQYSPG